MGLAEHRTFRFLPKCGAVYRIYLDYLVTGTKRFILLN
jgi:hypothetical protein